MILSLPLPISANKAIYVTRYVLYAACIPKHARYTMGNHGLIFVTVNGATHIWP